MSDTKEKKGITLLALVNHSYNVTFSRSSNTNHNGRKWVNR